MICRNARIRPELAAKYIELERRTGYGVFGDSDTLESRLAGIPIVFKSDEIASDA